MLDILTIVHRFADIQTAARIRHVCRRLGALTPDPKLYSEPSPYIEYEYRVGSKLHRLDGPARVYESGFRCWYRGDICHREYHPQCIGNFNTYMIEGVHHREAGPSTIYNENVVWCLRGLLHRKTGPAITWQEQWYTLGKYHRLDGPAYTNVYVIRGICHSISAYTNLGWIVGGVFIRR